MGFTTMGADSMIKHSLALLLAAVDTPTSQDAWWPRRRRIASSVPLKAARHADCRDRARQTGRRHHHLPRQKRPSWLALASLGSAVGPYAACLCASATWVPCPTIGNAPRFDFDRRRGGEAATLERAEVVQQQAAR